MHPGYTYSSDDIDLIGKHGYGRKLAEKTEKLSSVLLIFRA